MATAESVKEKLQGLIGLANTATGNTDTDLTAAVNALIAGFGQGGGSGVKVTEYIVTEDTDRSLWLNEQQIKLVKGVNLLVAPWLEHSTDAFTLVQGQLSLVLILWDGVAASTSSNPNTNSNKSHIRGLQVPCSQWTGFASITTLVAGNTTKLTAAEDGLLTCTTSATGVTTGNYSNSYLPGGFTYRLLQAESEVVC